MSKDEVILEELRRIAKRNNRKGEAFVQSEVAFIGDNVMIQIRQVQGSGVMAGAGKSLVEAWGDLVHEYNHNQVLFDWIISSCSAVAQHPGFSSR